MKSSKLICFSFIILGFLLNSSNFLLGQGNGVRKLTPAEKNINQARMNLPTQIYTEDPELTRQVHRLYVECLFDKLFEPAPPGLPYKWFSISGAADKSYGKVQLLWDPMFVLNAWAPLDDKEVVHDVFRDRKSVV